MTIEYKTKDQIWQEETTRYWFEISEHNYLESGMWGIDDCNGERTYVDCDGTPADQKDIAHLEKIEITQEMLDD